MPESFHHQYILPLLLLADLPGLLHHRHILPLLLRRLLTLLHHSKIKIRKRRMTQTLARFGEVLISELRELVNRWPINTKNAVRL
jgi:hypothetical protein